MSKKDIWIEEDTLYYTDHQSINTANLKVLKYAYVQILAEVPFLFLFADHQHYISTAQSGFGEVYQQLTDRFHFDDEMFFAVCKACAEDAKVKIWTKRMPKNYQILDGNPSDEDFGYEVQSEPKQLISWDTTYEQLEASGLVESYWSDFDFKYLRFKFPVRVQNILIDQLEIYVNNALPDRPLQEYFVSLYDDTNTDKSYKELRNLWIDDDIDIDQYGYERNDQCNLRFILAKGIEASICYTYDDESGYDDGSTSLHFYNTRTYDHFLDNEAYEEQMEISAILPLRKKLEINISHLDNNNIKHIPAKVKDVFKGKSGIWVDHVNKKIGFAGIGRSLILDGDAIDDFTFQNILPAKGPGYADFMVHLQTGNYLYAFAEDTYYFDQFEKELQQLTYKKVSIPEPYYNC